MIPYIYVANGELTSPKFAKAFANGCGAEEKFIENGQWHIGPWAGFGSPKIWQSLIITQNAGYAWYYGDHAYFGRGKFYRVTKNNFQCMEYDDPDYERLKPFYEAVKPYRKSGEHIVVCPQSNDHHDRHGQPNWLNMVLQKLDTLTDRPIIIRHKRDKKPLLADLKNAHCLITHTSNAAVESLLHGVPVICTGHCAAGQFGGKIEQIEQIETIDFDRLKWAATLANNQWTLAEIANGKCWEKIK